MPTQSNIESGGWKSFLDRVLPSIFIGMVMAVTGVLWVNYNSTQQLVSKVDQLQRDQDSQKAEIIAIKAGYMTRMEVLETIKRVEQQNEIMLLRAGVKATRSKD